jgi:hypothetical protein
MQRLTLITMAIKYRKSLMLLNYEHIVRVIVKSYTLTKYTILIHILEFS